MPDTSEDRSVLLAAASATLQRDVLPELGSPFARSRLNDARVLVACAEREQRYGEAVRAACCEDIGRLLKTQTRPYEQAIGQLVEAIAEERVADEPLIQLLARKAYREEWLYQPAAALYPERRWAALD